ncbi:amidohydrolase family protein [Mycobacterium intracellulare]|uniref:amidohydrolase family protein n=1 Tax=Mycobacterium intracellulare TaxID=1767 RepID=UPI00080B5662|nr:amidohydrolase family protein [Mycobacterium intracellulare]OCB27240.1 amidohydrolase [Mycobacterium intracellulare subsp. yongonense]
MTELGFCYFDCDNHYYEATDAFTRYIEPAYRRRAMQWAQINGKMRLLVAGKVNKFIPNPTFDPVAAPGVLDEYFRGRNPKGAKTSELFGELEPIRPEYRDRDARLELMDRQGMEGAIMLPTLGVGMEQALVHDLPALTAAFRAFNRWLGEDWGFAYQERIFAAPYITMSDPENAVRELEWALECDARFVVMVPGPVTTVFGERPPADSMFDGFWRLANDSGITVCYHGGETAYSKFLASWGENDETESFNIGPFRKLVSFDPVQDTFGSHLALGLFHRFPNLRVASIEVGSQWVFHLFEKLTKAYGQIPHHFPEDPRETFKRHVWVSPFYEDELASLLRLIGADHIIMGSDYPHVEGLADPASYIKDLQNFDYTADQCRTVMRDNGRALSVRRPA